MLFLPFIASQTPLNRSRRFPIIGGGASSGFLRDRTLWHAQASRRITLEWAHSLLLRWTRGCVAAVLWLPPAIEPPALWPRPSIVPAAPKGSPHGLRRTSRIGTALSAPHGNSARSVKGTTVCC